MSMSRFIRRKTITLWQEDGEDPVTLAVRGLSPADIGALLAEEEGALGQLYVALSTSDLSAEVVGAQVATFVETMPQLVARVIAHAIDEPDAWEDCLDIATGTQVELLEAIAKLTFASDQSAKKAWGAVKAFAAKAADKSRQSGSGIGSGA